MPLSLHHLIPFPRRLLSLFFFNDTATTEIYTLSLHDALPISPARCVFFNEYGLTAPPRVVGSLAMTMQGTPSTTPMPVTTLAPTEKSVPQAASGHSSRNGES